MTSFAIGCLVQWYEVDIVEEYIDSLADSIDFYDKENVTVDVLLTVNQELEKANSPERLNYCKEKINEIVRTRLKGYKLNFSTTVELVTIADYRREFNDKYCDSVDVLIWGESDMLVPKQAFQALNSLHSNVNTSKYLATFSICKMWDDSWKPLEHVEFTDKPFIEGDTQNWWSLRYTMSKEEMNAFNDKTQDLEVTLIKPHKYNGCGLVISSEVIRSGVNIPKSVFFIHEDTAFMLMTQKVLGNIPQYHFKNLLVVHNRKHPQKRKFIKGEENVDKTDTGALRKVHNWYQKANKMCEQNCYSLFNPDYKSFTWEDVFTEE